MGIYGHWNIKTCSQGALTKSNITFKRHIQTAITTYRNRLSVASKQTIRIFRHSLSPYPEMEDTKTHHNHQSNKPM